MPAFIKSYKPRPFFRKNRFNSELSTPFRVAAGSSVGTSTVSGVSAAIASSVASSDGVATVSGIGAGVIGSPGTSAGSATVLGVGAAYNVAIGLSSGSSIVLGVAELKQIISRKMLQDTVDCVLADQQMEFRKGRASRQALRHVFNE